VLADLLAAVERQLAGIKARAPIVLAGHSGAWRTLGGWTEDKRVETILLLDALYGSDDKFQGFVAHHPEGDQPRLTLVTKDTASRVAPFLEGLAGVRRRASLPDAYSDLSPTERSAPVLELQSDLGHMEIITSGKVLPVLLHRSPLKSVRPPRFIRPKKGQVASE
jgi:hypothetical protein